MGYGAGVGRGLAKNAQATTPGELGFGRGPRGGSLRSGLGHASDPMWPTPIRLLARS
ncbi:hypothetical protein Hanom_Chr17g01568871 [Helianthus anomalus]